MTDDDARVMRQRASDALDGYGRYLSDQDQGTPAQLVKTTHISSYPTTASAFYACQPALASGTETEGSTITWSTYGDPLLALNIGTGVPTEGSYVIVHQVGGLWVFRYD